MSATFTVDERTMALPMPAPVPALSTGGGFSNVSTNLESPDGDTLTLVTAQQGNPDVAPFAEGDFDLYSDLMDDQYLPPLSQMNANVPRARIEEQAEQPESVELIPTQVDHPVHTDDDVLVPTQVNCDEVGGTESSLEVSTASWDADGGGAGHTDPLRLKKGTSDRS